MESYLLAVDGGGSKTVFLLADMAGNLISRILCGPSSHKSVGVSTARHNLEFGLGQTLTAAGISLHQIAFSVWGISGCDAESDYALFRRIAAELGLPPERCHICNDAAMAYFAAAEAPGVILVCGTGAIAVGVQPDGRFCRTGGWGYQFSDLGSGQWLGNAALRETLLYCDGCRPFVPWFNRVREHFGAADFCDLPERVTTIQDYSSIAGLAPILFGASQEPLAAAILQEGAGYLAQLVRSCVSKLSLAPKAPCSLVLAGGCLKNLAYRRMVLEQLHSVHSRAGLNLSFLEQDPALGGINLAKNLSLQIKKEYD